MFDVENADLNKYEESLGKTLGEALITPTRIYVKPVLALLDEIKVKSIAHITGGGFYENIPRALPKGKKAVIDQASVRILPIFKLIAERGGIPMPDMFSTFNMGVGMITIVAKEDVEKALEILKANGEDAYVIGHVEDGEHGIELC